MELNIISVLNYTLKFLLLKIAFLEFIYELIFACFKSAHVFSYLVLNSLFSLNQALIIINCLWILIFPIGNDFALAFPLWVLNPCKVFLNKPPITCFIRFSSFICCFLSESSRSILPLIDRKVFLFLRSSLSMAYCLLFWWVFLSNSDCNLSRFSSCWCKYYWSCFCISVRLPASCLLRVSGVSAWFSQAFGGALRCFCWSFCPPSQKRQLYFPAISLPPSGCASPAFWPRVFCRCRWTPGSGMAAPECQTPMCSYNKINGCCN